MSQHHRMVTVTLPWDLPQLSLSQCHAVTLTHTVTFVASGCCGLWPVGLVECWLAGRDSDGLGPGVGGVRLTFLPRRPLPHGAAKPCSSRRPVITAFCRCTARHAHFIAHTLPSKYCHWSRLLQSSRLTVTCDSDTFMDL